MSTIDEICYSFRMLEFFERLETIEGELCILGDFNIDLNAIRTTEQENDYLEILADYDFIVRNCETTRVTVNTKTCMDHNISTTMNYVHILIFKINYHDFVLTEIEINRNL